MSLPLRHISIRVPWHDTGWDGRVCAAPRLNGACLKLNRIAEDRDDDAEEAVAGQSIKELPQDKWPSCVAERVGFMAPFEYTRMANHPYNHGPETSHGHFKPTALRHPPYSAPVIPFAWMLRENTTKLCEQYDLDFQSEREPTKEDLGFNKLPGWIQERLNQTALLDCFADHLRPEHSLCFFYAKQVPFVEDAAGGRILIGVGRVLHIGQVQEYTYTTKDLKGKLRSILWERMIQHSIRPDFKDGFLLPYHAAIQKAAEDPDFDPAEIAAFSPADRLIEFSHASQLVTHDGAIASLLACAESLRKTKGILPGSWDCCLEWIDAWLGELWKARGPCPGLGAALSAFGLELGTFVARALTEKAGDNADPWPLVDKMFADPKKHLPAHLTEAVGKTLCAKWARLPDDRRSLLKLVSRFEITREQATTLYVQEERSKAGIESSDAAILSNPYLLYESTRLTADPISVWTVDRGVFPDEVIRKKHPLPELTALDAGSDARRVRALTVKVLEDAAGKARVRMEQSTKNLKLKGYTIAQFLRPHRYDGTTGRYQLSDKLAEVGARTVIIDEASMLTEEMLAALIQALKGVHRLILIGDPRQLPPIGAGRPFVDIVKHLAPEGILEKFPRVGPGYTELTIRRRQAGEDREDLQFAEWFSGSPIAPGEDDVFDKVVRTGLSKHVRFIQWETADDLRASLIDALVDELKLTGPEDIAGFDAILGGTAWNEMRFFNFGAAQKSEGWQILSPVRSAAHGVPDLNRLIHKQFRQSMIDAARKKGWSRKYPKPMGSEEIVYGDKVINIVNTDPSLWWNKHRKVYPSKDDAYIANGEIGMAVGFFWKKGLPDLRWKLEVEFSSQPGFKYDYTSRDFGEEGNPVLELAYALTVHKAQGSEFGTVFLVLPNPCRLLSRELLYTALTRQKNRVVILHQGPRTDLRKFSSDDRSETARRLTNLFVAPSPILVDGRFFEEHLIHRTARGEMVRSKSEIIIADHLANKGVEYCYEQPLTIAGVTKYPDFTVEDMESGSVYYWEHCGMLHIPNYRRRWQEKLAWYKAHGILPHQEGGGAKGTLIVTRDEPNGSIDSASITKLIAEVLRV